jgi:hypothetical protein
MHYLRSTMRGLHPHKPSAAGNDDRRGPLRGAITSSRDLYGRTVPRGSDRVKEMTEHGRI